MTEEQARHHAEAVARSMGITFYVVCTRKGELMQLPSDDCEIVATVEPPGSPDESRQFDRG